MRQPSVIGDCRHPSSNICQFPSIAMAPIRRYLRITQYSVLEVRIYLDNPSLASSWLLRPRNPVLPRVIEAVRPLVLPKLKEENARERSKAKNRKKGVKDVVVEGNLWRGAYPSFCSLARLGLMRDAKLTMWTKMISRFRFS